MWLRVQFMVSEERDGVRLSYEVAEPSTVELPGHLRTRLFDDRETLVRELARIGLTASIASGAGEEETHEVRSFQMDSLGFPGFPVPYIRASCFVIEVPQQRQIAHWTVAEDGSYRAWRITVGSPDPSLTTPIKGPGTRENPDGYLYKVTDFHTLVDEDVLERECVRGNPPLVEIDEPQAARPFLGVGSGFNRRP